MKGDKVMKYDNSDVEHKLLVDFGQELPFFDSSDGKLVIPIDNYPYNMLIFDSKNTLLNTRLIQYDYNYDMEIFSIPCKLNQTEIDNLLKICHPVIIQ